MTFLLDTDICSAHFRRRSGMAHRFMQHTGRLAISSVTLAELYVGAFHLANPQPLLTNITDLLADVTVIDFDQHCALHFGMVRGTLLQQGTSIPTADLMIAATALCHGMTLVTHNVSDYANVPGLNIIDWLAP